MTEDLFDDIDSHLKRSYAEGIVNILLDAIDGKVEHLPNGIRVWTFTPMTTAEYEAKMYRPPPPRGLYEEAYSDEEEPPPEGDKYEEAVWPLIAKRTRRKRPAPGNPSDGYIYLLHFETRLEGGTRYAQHYLGWAKNLDKRLAKHRQGNGSALMAAVSKVPIGWVLAASWPGDRAAEKWYKRQRHHHRFCPICRGEIGYQEAINADRRR